MIHTFPFAEAEYAYNLRIPCIPLMGEAGYKPTGWLGALIGAKLYYRMDNKEQIEQNFPALVRTIGNKGRIRPPEETPAPAPKNAPGEIRRVQFATSESHNSVTEN